jgi:hypothetical protein
LPELARSEGNSALFDDKHGRNARMMRSVVLIACESCDLALLSVENFNAISNRTALDRKLFSLRSECGLFYTIAAMLNDCDGPLRLVRVTIAIARRLKRRQQRQQSEPSDY